MTNTIGKIGATIHRPRTIFLPSSKARSEKFRYLEGYKKSIIVEEEKNWIPTGSVKKVHACWM
jgi:hypothetical protein